MSHWDFGRPADGQQDASGRPGPASTGYPPDPPYAAEGEEWPEDEPWPAENGWSAEDGGAAADPWPAREWTPDGSWSPDGDWPAPGTEPRDASWPAAEPASPDEGWSAEDGWVGSEETGPYPLTYERDDFAAGAPPQGEASPDSWPPQPQPAAPRPRWRPGLAPEGPGDGDAGWPDDGGPEGQARDAAAGWQPPPPPDGWTSPGPGLPGQVDFADWPGPGARRRGRRWLIPAGVAVAGAAVGAVAVLMSGGHPAAQGGQGASGATAAGAAPAGTAPSGTAPSGTGQASTGPAGTGPANAGRGTPAGTAPASQAAAPLTMTEAKAALANYTTANNSANAQRSGQLLASVESGSSYAIDAGLYQEQQAAGNAPYPAFTPVQATYYIPRDQPASGPRWFAVQVANAFAANPAKVTSSEYLLFTQAAPGGAWLETAEPYLLSGAGAPQVAVGADGLATAVGADAATVAVAPGQLASATATSLDAAGGAGPAVANPGNLADQGDQRFWQGKVPGGQVSDTHAAAAGADGQEFALQTTDGGALVFYPDAAQVTITPPAGSSLHLTIPGFYSPDQSLPRAGVTYLDQFAAYDPPAAGGGAPRVVADYSGITGKD
jgi:hypothetical protein